MSGNRSRFAPVGSQVYIGLSQSAGSGNTFVMVKDTNSFGDGYTVTKGTVSNNPARLDFKQYFRT